MKRSRPEQHKAASGLGGGIGSVASAIILACYLASVAPAVSAAAARPEYLFDGGSSAAVAVQPLASPGGKGAQELQAVSLASADLDEDGVEDLAVAYRNGQEAQLTLFRGRLSSLFPGLGDQRSRSLDSSDAFESPEVISPVLGIVPDLLFSGDFDGDGHQDLVAAKIGDDRLVFLFGDGSGAIRSDRELPLDATVTTLQVADVNRRDGLLDVLVGIAGKGSYALRILEHPLGATHAEALDVGLPAPALGVCAGRYVDLRYVDVAVMHAHQISLIGGQDRRLILSPARKPNTPVEVRSAPLPDAAAGIWSVHEPGTKRDIGLLDVGARGEGGGWLRVDEDGQPEVSANKSSAPQWTEAQTPAVAFNRLKKGRVSPGILANLAEQYLAASPTQEEGKVLAGVPMRLNRDALADFVAIVDGNPNPVVLSSRAAHTFVVTSTGDAGDSNTADDLCDAGGGVCTLRAAIQQANASGGVDEILFNIAGGGVHAVIPGTSLPEATEPLTIDATSQPGYMGTPLIQLYLLLLNEQVYGLSMGGGSSVFRGFLVNGMPGNGAFLGLKFGNGGGYNIAESNFVCTDASGATILGTSGIGIQCDGGPDDQIGGTNAASRNVVSGCAVGLSLDSTTGTIVEGNTFGTTADGTARIAGSAPWGANATRISYCVGTTVGGHSPGAGNLISGTNQSLWLLSGSGNLAVGNKIGTDATGLSAIENNNGVRIDGAGATTIGSAASSGRNVIAGNGNGVTIIGSESPDCVVVGNYIGVGADGSSPIGNNLWGILVSQASGATIGGAVEGAGNVSSANGWQGVWLYSSSSLATVQGNLIGTDATGMNGLPNLSGGILISNASSHNTIGGSNAGEANLVAFNAVYGLRNENGIFNGLFENSIHSNAGPGIDLGTDGPTTNDLGDGDIGANLLQNYPVLSAASACNGPVNSLEGSLNSTASTSFRLEFFSNDSCDPTGFGEGQTFVGFTSATTDSQGNTPFSFQPASPLEAGSFLTSTATDPSGNTSEFSQCVLVSDVSPVPVVSGDSSVCEGEQSTLDAGPGFTSYAWSNGGAAQTVVVSPAVTTEYWVEVTAANGCSGTSDPFSVAVNPYPAPVVAGPSSICSGQTGTLDAGAGYSTYSWSTGATTRTIDVGPATTTTYSVSVTTAAGCPGTSPEHEVGVRQSPAPVITGPTAVCSGEEAALDAGAGYTGYLWSTGATTQEITVSPGQTTDYTVTVTNNEGCPGTSATHTLNVHQAAQPVVTGPSSVCAGDEAILDAGAGYSTYLWSTGETSQQITVAPLTTSGYSVTATTTDGCLVTSELINLTVNPRPTPVVSGPSAVCSGATAVLDAGGGYASYLWSTGATTQEIQVSPTGAADFTVTVTSTEGCSATSAPFTLGVNANPAVEAGPDIPGCVNDAPFDIASGSPPGGVWSGTGITNGAAGTFDPAQAGDGLHTLMYLYSDVNGCSAADNLLATVDGEAPLPVRNLSVEAPGDCSATIGWTHSPSDDVAQYNVYWDGGTGSVDFGTPIGAVVHPGNSLTAGSLPDGEYQFAVRASDGCGLEDDSDDVVGVSPCHGGCVKFNEQGNSLCSANGCFKVTYYATNNGGCLEGLDVDLLRFQYRTCGTGPWWDMASCNPSTQNPMPVPPSGKAMIHWSVVFVPDGCYQLRVLPTINGVQAPSAPFGTIEKGCNDPSVMEHVNSQSEYETQVKVFANVDQQVEHGDPLGAPGDGPDSQPSTVVMPAGALAADDTVVVSFPDPDEQSLRAITGFQNGREFRRISLLSGQPALQSAMTIEMSYHDQNGNGLVDNPLGQESTKVTDLKIYHFDAGVWSVLADSQVDLERRLVTGTTSTTGLFGLLAAEATATIFNDGFESGDAGRWSLAEP